MLDWGLRLVVLLAVPSSVALLVFGMPLVATLFHYGAFTPRDVLMVSTALTGYGVGLLGLVAIKVLAPGYYANQDMRTPVRIAIVVLVATQLMNVVFVPLLGHAGLALSIGLGALLNAGWLMAGLRRRGSWKPSEGWGRFLLQVVAASALLAVFLTWASAHFDWVQLRETTGRRLLLLGGMLVAAMALYFGALAAAGLKLRQFVNR
jgi:putative peptidoglycan lipid II flippase